MKCSLRFSKGSFAKAGRYIDQGDDAQATFGCILMAGQLVSEIMFTAIFCLCGFRHCTLVHQLKQYHAKSCTINIQKNWEGGVSNGVHWESLRRIATLPADVSILATSNQRSCNRVSARCPDAQLVVITWPAFDHDTIEVM